MCSTGCNCKFYEDHMPSIYNPYVSSVPTSLFSFPFKHNCFCANMSRGRKFGNSLQFWKQLKCSSAQTLVYCLKVLQGFWSRSPNTSGDHDGGFNEILPILEVVWLYGHWMLVGGTVAQVAPLPVKLWDRKASSTNPLHVEITLDTTCTFTPLGDAETGQVFGKVT